MGCAYISGGYIGWITAAVCTYTREIHADILPVGSVGWGNAVLSCLNDVRGAQKHPKLLQDDLDDQQEDTAAGGQSEDLGGKALVESA